MKQMSLTAIRVLFLVAGAYDLILGGAFHAPHNQHTASCFKINSRLFKKRIVG